MHFVIGAIESGRSRRPHRAGAVEVVQVRHNLREVSCENR